MKSQCKGNKHRQFSAALCLVSLAYSMNSRSVRNPVSKTKVTNKEQHTHTHTCLNINVFSTSKELDSEGRI